MGILHWMHNAVDWVADKTDAIPVVGTVTGFGKNVTDYAADKWNNRPTSLLHLAHDATDTIGHTFRYVPGVRIITNSIKDAGDKAANAWHGMKRAKKLYQDITSLPEKAMNFGGDLLKGIGGFLGDNKMGVIGALIAGAVALFAGGPLIGLLVAAGAFLAGSFLGDGDKGAGKGLLSRFMPSGPQNEESQSREAALQARQNALGDKGQGRGGREENPNTPNLPGMGQNQSVQQPAR